MNGSRLSAKPSELRASRHRAKMPARNGVTTLMCGRNPSLLSNLGHRTTGQLDSEPAKQLVSEDLVAPRTADVLFAKNQFQTFDNHGQFTSSPVEQFLHGDTLAPGSSQPLRL